MGTCDGADDAFPVLQDGRAGRVTVSPNPSHSEYGTDLATSPLTPAVAARTRNERDGAIERQERVLRIVLLKQLATAWEHQQQLAWEQDGAALPKNHRNDRPPPRRGIVPRPTSAAASTGRPEPVRSRSREPRPHASSHGSVEEIKSRWGGMAESARWTRARRDQGLVAVGRGNGGSGSCRVASNSSGSPPGEDDRAASWRPPIVNSRRPGNLLSSGQ